MAWSWPRLHSADAKLADRMKAAVSKSLVMLYPLYGWRDDSINLDSDLGEGRAVMRAPVF